MTTTESQSGQSPNAESPSTESLSTVAELDYASAVAELDNILTELEDEALNVDILTERVARASELITFCRDRITSAKLGVEQIVADLEELGDAE